MYICKNCGETYSYPINRCGKCGCYIEPALSNNIPAYNNFAGYRTRPAVIPGRGKGITSLIFSLGNFTMLIFAAIFSIIALDCALNFEGETQYDFRGDPNYFYWRDYDSWVTATTFSYIASSLLITLCISGIAFAKSSRKSGYLTGVSKTGMVFNIITLAFAITTFLLTVTANIIPL